jgi:hypothetical protein
MIDAVVISAVMITAIWHGAMRSAGCPSSVSRMTATVCNNRALE